MPKAPGEVTAKAPLPEFDTVAWLGTIMKGPLPLPEGRKIIAEDMLCAA
jgi:hypothetical protein